MKNTSDRTYHGYLAVIGVVIAIIGIVGFTYSSHQQGVRRGANLIGGPGTLVELEIPMSLNVSDSGVIRVNYLFANAPEIDSTGQVITQTEYRNITITLQTSSFDTSPLSGEPVAKLVRNELSYEWIWTIKPNEPGLHYIVLQFSGVPGPLLAEVASGLEVDHLQANSTIMDTSSWTSEQIGEQLNTLSYVYNLVVPIRVVNLFGLTPLQAKIASSVTTFLGSGLTVTWLYEQWYKKRSDESKKRHSKKRKRRK